MKSYRAHLLTQRFAGCQNDEIGLNQFYEYTIRFHKHLFPSTKKMSENVMERRKNRK